LCQRSWRRNAWQHVERREPELLHRLLCDGASEGEVAASTPSSLGLLPSGAAASASRGRATGKHLLALTALLALAVLLLHLLHSHALAKQLTDEAQEQLPQAQRDPAAAAVLGGGPAGQGGVPLGKAAAAALLHSRQGGASLGWASGQRALGRLPRLRLRRRLTLLLFAQPSPHSRGSAAADQAEGTRQAEELVWEEWEVEAS
jgi:hypothetical protein